MVVVRMFRYEELHRQLDELNAYMKILASEVEKLRKEARELRSETNASKQRISQLQGETNNLRFQREEVGNFVEILAKERDSSSGMSVPSSHGRPGVSPSIDLTRYVPVCNIRSISKLTRTVNSPCPECFI